MAGVNAGRRSDDELSRVLTRQQVVQAPERIRLLKAEQVADAVFGGSVTPRWVRLNVPGKRKYGHRTLLWFEHEVREWVLSRGS